MAKRRMRTRKREKERKEGEKERFILKNLFMW